MAAQILIYGAFMATRPPRQSIQGTPFNSAEFEHGDKVAQINVDPMIMPQAELKANPPREQGRLAGLRIARWLAQIKHPEEKIPIGKDFGAAPRPRRRAPLVFVALCALAAAGVGVAFLYGRGTETTDNAQVEGHLINISSRVGGQVTQVLVQDNQQVKKGDVLLELDRTDLDVRLQSAKAEVASAKAGVQSARAQLALTERNLDAVLEQAQGGVVQASAGLGSSRASIDQAQADIAAARARLSLAQTELTRVQRLRDENAVSQAEMEGKQAAFDQALAAVEQARARYQGANTLAQSWAGSVTAAHGHLVAAQSRPEQIATVRAALDLASARLDQAQANLRQAELNLSYATIKAPVHGMVSRRVVEVGQMITQDRPLLVLVPLDDVWVVANFKESQIASMRPGQQARIRIDAFPDGELLGHVDSIASATGSRFSLLPPDNASGNFVKVVQRIPVLVRLDGGKGGQQGSDLRPGMSATVTILTGRP